MGVAGRRWWLGWEFRDAAGGLRVRVWGRTRPFQSPLASRSCGWLGRGRWKAAEGVRRRARIAKGRSHVAEGATRRHGTREVNPVPSVCEGVRGK